jgi:hypothetical protein
MADKKISDLTAATNSGNADLMEIETSGGLSRKIIIGNAAHPIGETYMQHYGKSTPATLYGGTWSLLYNNECISFMTEGSAGATYEAETFDGSVKDSQFQGHGHAERYYNGQADGGDIFRAITGGTSNNTLTRTGAGLSISTVTILEPSTLGVYQTPRIGLATKSRRRIVRIWERTA